MRHYQLNYAAELLNWSTCLFRPGYLQTWAQISEGHGDMSVNRVHEFVKASSRMHHKKKG